MIDKQFDELSVGEKYQLQKIMKKKSTNEKLTPDELALYERFSEEFIKAEKTVKAKWPIIIGLIVISLLAILRNCGG